MGGVNSYKFLKIEPHNKLNWNFSIKKMINRGRKGYYGHENNCKSLELWLRDKKRLIFETLIITIILYHGYEILGWNISREPWGKIENYC